MKLSPQEKAARKAAFRSLSPAKKLEHIYLYYKWPILLGLIALLVLTSVLHRQLTAKEPVLYEALVNVSVGEDLQERLPWEITDMLVCDSYFQQEYKRALAGETTPDCRSGCNGCFGAKYADICQL